jgi:hypothetical protein
MKKIITALFVFVLLSSFVYSEIDRPDNAAIKIDSLKYEPYPVEAGSYFKLWIKVENFGNEQTDDASFILEPRFPFSLDSNEAAERNLGQLDVAEEVVLEYLVRVDHNAIQGDNELEFKFTANGMAWITHTFNIYIRTHDTMLNVEDVSVNPQEVGPGEVFTLDIKLRNMADSVIKDLRAELELTRRDVLSASVEYSELPFTPIGSTNLLMAKRINPLEQKIFSFELRVDPDAEPKVYRIPLTLSYSDDLGNETIEESTVAVVVSMEPNVMVNLDDKSVYQSNSKGDVSIGVYNTGVSSVKFASLELKETQDYEILSNPIIYLGNIDSDDYETADFNIYTNKEDPGLLFELRYKDEFNKEYIKSGELSLNTYSSEEAKRYGFVQGKNNSWVFLVILVLAIGGWFWFKKYKKKKHH